MMMIVAAMRMVMGMTLLMGVHMMMAVEVSVAFRRNIRGAFLLSMNDDADVRPLHATFDGRLAIDVHAWKSQHIDSIQKSSRIGMQFQQRGHQHIARRAHIAFNIECFHRKFLLSSCYFSNFARRSASTMGGMIAI